MGTQPDRFITPFSPPFSHKERRTASACPEAAENDLSLMLQGESMLGLQWSGKTRGTQGTGRELAQLG